MRRPIKAQTETYLSVRLIRVLIYFLPFFFYLNSEKIDLCGQHTDRHKSLQRPEQAVHVRRSAHVSGQVTGRFAPARVRHR